MTDPAVSTIDETDVITARTITPAATLMIFGLDWFLKHRLISRPIQLELHGGSLLLAIATKIHVRPYVGDQGKSGPVVHGVSVSHFALSRHHRSPGSFDPVSGKPGPSVVGLLRPDGFMLKSDHSIAFAVTHFTIRSDNSPVDEFLWFKAEPDGKVVTSTAFLNAATHSIERRSEFECTIGAGVEFKYRDAD